MSWNGTPSRRRRRPARRTSRPGRCFAIGLPAGIPLGQAATRNTRLSGHVSDRTSLVNTFAQTPPPSWRKRRIRMSPCHNTLCLTPPARRSSPSASLRRLRSVGLPGRGLRGDIGVRHRPQSPGAVRQRTAGGSGLSMRTRNQPHGTTRLGRHRIVRVVDPIRLVQVHPRSHRVAARIPVDAAIAHGARALSVTTRILVGGHTARRYALATGCAVDPCRRPGISSDCGELRRSRANHSREVDDPGAETLPERARARPRHARRSPRLLRTAPRRPHHLALRHLRRRHPRPAAPRRLQRVAAHRAAHRCAWSTEAAGHPPRRPAGSSPARRDLHQPRRSTSCTVRRTPRRAGSLKSSGTPGNIRSRRHL